MQNKRMEQTLMPRAAHPQVLGFANFILVKNYIENDRIKVN